MRRLEEYKRLLGILYMRRKKGNIDPTAEKRKNNYYFEKGFQSVVCQMPTTGSWQQGIPIIRNFKKMFFKFPFFRNTLSDFATRICDPPGNEYAQGYRVQFYFPH